MVCLFLGGGSLRASALVPDDEFNPTSPAEPKSVSICRITVTADPVEGAYFSGGGKYEVNGNSVHISTSAKNTEDYTYTFLYWTLNGEQTSYSQNFWFTPEKGTYNFVAHYQKSEVVFDPDNPAEPSGNVKRKYYLYLTSNIEGACSFSMASGNKIIEGSNLNIAAYPNSGYQFECWKKDGTEISTSQYLYIAMPSSNTTLEACFTEIPYDPENPKEPTGPGTNVDNTTRLLMDITIGPTGAPTDKTRIVVNETKTVSYDIGFDIAKMLSDEADYQIYSLDADNIRYSINERPVGDGMVPLGIIVRKSGELTFGVKRLDCNAVLVDKYLNKKQDLALGEYTFNCEAGTFEDRFCIQLPKAPVLGDVNDDGAIDIADAVCIVNHIVGKATPVFVEAAADVNNDGDIDIADAVRVVNLIVGKTNTLARQKFSSLPEPE